jgi:hypothetical protein
MRPRFVRGTLLRNEPGATYQKVVYDRFLTVRMPTGDELRVFDMGDPISEDLEPGLKYELVLVVTVPQGLRQGAERAPDTHWAAHVLEASWRANLADFARVRPELLDRDWVLAETAIGSLLLSPRDIPRPVIAGENIRWDEARFDLFGIVGPDA